MPFPRELKEPQRPVNTRTPLSFTLFVAAIAIPFAWLVLKSERINKFKDRYLGIPSVGSEDPRDPRRIVMEVQKEEKEIFSGLERMRLLFKDSSSLKEAKYVKDTLEAAVIPPGVGEFLKSNESKDLSTVPEGQHGNVVFTRSVKKNEDKSDEKEE